MKRKSMVFFLMLIAANCFAQKVEIIGKYPFGNPVEYTEEWNPYEGQNPGISGLTVWNNDFFIYNSGRYSYHLLNNTNQEVKFSSSDYPFHYSLLVNKVILIGESAHLKTIKVYIDSKDLAKPDYVLDIEKDKLEGDGGVYYTDKKLFLNGVYWDLLPNGQTKFHNEQQCKAEMEDGLADQLGVSITGNTVYFGENCTTDIEAPNRKNYWNNIKFVTPGCEYLDENIGACVGVDKHGIAYYYRYTNSAGDKRPLKNPDLPITLSIIALDPWTHEAYVLKLPEGAYNPSRNKNGLIAVCSQCIDKDGNYYFTDCNKAEGCYELKKVSNEWVKQYDFYNREIGIMNANHIPLQNEASLKAENNGYNFDNEYLWILEKKNGWCRVRKVDGREGWVESKYITFDDGKSDVPVVNSKTVTVSKPSDTPSYNVAKNKIMQTNDNLRLRKEEATSSEVITTMLKGTKVKILKLGKEETIDGIKSCWVQVEVQKGGKDKNGKPIAAGTKGWCYGGYLE